MNHAMKQYQKESGVFQYEIYAKLRSDSKRAWVFAGAMATVALLSTVALVIALPLKQTETVVIAVDKTTGYMEVTTELEQRGRTLSQEEKVIHFELMRYLDAREGYFHPIQQKRYDLVMALSSKRAADEYADLWDIDNKDNPSVIYGNNGTVDVRVKSIMHDKNIAQIRFERRLKLDDKITTSHWIAFITFDHHLDRKQNMNEIAANPLSFTVSDYRLAEENME